MKPNYTDIINESKNCDLYSKKYIKTKKDNPILYNEESYDHLDWLYVAEAKQTTKYNPEGMKVRQKIIRRLKDGI